MDTQEFTSADFERLLKYPRTAHLEGSRLQKGDDGSDQLPYSRLKGRYVVIEEKVDAANSGLSYNDGGDQLLQSRGHYLTGGGREKQFALFKKWAGVHSDAFLRRFQERYVVYGEWMHQLHSVFYDALPHYWLEFDIFDRTQPLERAFLSTARRRELLAGLPILSVPVLYEGVAPERLRDLVALVKHSLAKSANWRAIYELQAHRAGVPLDQAWTRVFNSDLAEGLYIKVEEDGHVVERYKWVCPDFVQTIIESGKHHSEQIFIPNLLRAGVDIYAPQLTHDWAGQVIQKG